MTPLLYIYGSNQPVPQTAPADVNRSESSKSPSSDAAISLNSPHQLHGPLMKINQNIARYDCHSNIEERVLLQTSSDGKICESFLKLENLGSTKISFNFKRAGEQNGISPPRFFFDKLGGVIAPGKVLDFSFKFKSSKPGIFTENWELLTEPKLCDGGVISIRLYAISYWLKVENYRA